MGPTAGLLSAEALMFLERSSYKDKSHPERMTLLKQARELYPNPNDQGIPPGECPGMESEGGCHSKESQRCVNYKCYSCWWG